MENAQAVRLSQAARVGHHAGRASSICLFWHVLDGVFEFLRILRNGCITRASRSHAPVGPLSLWRRIVSLKYQSGGIGSSISLHGAPCLRDRPGAVPAREVWRTRDRARSQRCSGSSSAPDETLSKAKSPRARGASGWAQNSARQHGEKSPCSGRKFPGVRTHAWQRCQGFTRSPAVLRSCATRHQASQAVTSVADFTSRPISAGRCALHSSGAVGIQARVAFGMGPIWFGAADREASGWPICGAGDGLAQSRPSRLLHHRSRPPATSAGNVKEVAAAPCQRGLLRRASRMRGAHLDRVRGRGASLFSHPQGLVAHNTCEVSPVSPLFARVAVPVPSGQNCSLAPPLPQPAFGAIALPRCTTPSARPPKPRPGWRRDIKPPTISSGLAALRR